MTQVPTKESVIADFDNHIIRRSGREFRFFQKEDKYFMEMTVPRPNSSGSSAQSNFRDGTFNWGSPSTGFLVRDVKRPQCRKASIHMDNI